MWHNENECLISCGRCPGCTKKRASVWGFRLVKEEERSRSSFFVTLTYDTAYVPITPNGFMTLSKKPQRTPECKYPSDDVQLFFKRLRKIHSKHVYSRIYPIRYYVAGEYGDTRSRPHYHIILFNSNQQDVLNAWTNTDTKEALGSVYFGTVTGASIAYCLKYISKPTRVPLHKRDDRRKEFAYMSKGLGSNYLTPAIIRWHTNDLDTRYYLPLKGGARAPMARYYRERIYSPEQFGYLKGVLEKLTNEKLEQFKKLHGENWSHVQAEKHKAQWQNMYKKQHSSNF